VSNQKNQKANEKTDLPETFTQDSDSAVQDQVSSLLAELHQINREDNPEAYADAQVSLGNLYDFQGNQEKAEETHQKAKDILEGRKIDSTFYPVIYGADEVLYLEENKKELEAIGNALIGAKEKHNPSVIFLGSTLNGKDLANIVASEIKVPAFVDVVAVKYENDKYLMTLPMYGGNILKEVTFEGDKTLVIAVRSGACKKEIFEGASGEITKEKA